MEQTFIHIHFTQHSPGQNTSEILFKHLAPIYEPVLAGTGIKTAQWIGDFTPVLIEMFSTNFKIYFLLYKTWFKQIHDIQENLFLPSQTSILPDNLSVVPTALLSNNIDIDQNSVIMKWIGWLCAYCLSIPSMSYHGLFQPALTSLISILANPFSLIALRSIIPSRIQTATCRPT